MKRLTPVKAIRAKCIECSCGQVSEIRNCLIPNCPLYPYRMGHRPKDTTEDDNCTDTSAFSDSYFEDEEVYTQES